MAGLKRPFSEFPIDEFVRKAERAQILEAPPANRVQLEEKANAAGVQAQARKEHELGVPVGGWDLRCQTQTWTCPECGETLQRMEVAGLQTGDFPPCSCQREAYRKAVEEYKRTHWKDAAAGQWADMGLPSKLQRASLETFIERPGTEEALKAVAGYVADFELGVTTSGLYFVGKYGSGKTHLAIATARAVAEKTLAYVTVISAADLLGAVKATFDKNKGSDGLKQWQREGATGRTYGDLLDEAKRVELLVLDDLGQEGYSEWGRGILDGLINARYEAELPTFVTSNLPPGEGLAELIGGRAVSRLKEMTDGVILQVSDYRIEKGDQRRGGKGQA